MRLMSGGKLINSLRRLVVGNSFMSHSNVLNDQSKRTNEINVIKKISFTSESFVRGAQLMGQHQCR